MLFVATALASAIACGPSVDQYEYAPEGSDPEDGGPDGNGPYARCRSSSIAADLSTNTCGQAGTFGTTNDFAEPGTACTACLCDSGCRDSAQCPLPQTGTAAPACRGNKCVLPCTLDSECPDEMSCVELAQGLVCAWTESDPLVCAVEVGVSDPCTGLPDQATCDATLSETSSLRCLWAESQILSANGSCEVASSESGCHLVQASANNCEEQAACTPGGHTYWKDLGASTVQMLTFPCEWEPVQEGAAGNDTPSDLCDHSGAVAVPLVCGCACD